MPKKKKINKPKVANKEGQVHTLYHKIINYLRTLDGEKCTLRKLLKHFSNEAQNLEATIQALEKDHLILINSQGVVKLLRTQKLRTNTVEATLDFSTQGTCYAILGKEIDDIKIAQNKTGNGLHGDKVLLNISREGQKKKLFAEVIEIIERKNKVFVGQVVKQNSTVFVVPNNPRVHVDFFIPKGKSLDAQHGDQVLVNFIQWDSNKPEAEIKQIFDKNDAQVASMQRIVLEHGFELEFDKEVLNAALGLSEQITDEEKTWRKDLRHLPTFTIDPYDAKDFDDAISVRVVENNFIEIGVHIADVSHYVAQDSILDKAALQRATSVYLVNGVVPMLPETISNVLCSLRPNEDKRCFSVVFVFNTKGKIVKTEYCRSLIHSQHRFTYDQAQEVLDGKEHDFSEALTIANKIAHQLRKERFKNGAISFESKEIKFVLNEEGFPTQVIEKQRKDAHLLIEDFMLLANKSVAEFLQNQKSIGVYRCHDLPDTEKLHDLANLALGLGYKLKLDTPNQIAHSLNELCISSQTKPENAMLQSLALRAMAKAYYSTKNIGHYGLGFEWYSHFTSPIRRYPDIMTHRLLWSVLQKQKSNNEEALEQQCKHSSVMERQAMEAERASNKYFQMLFMKDKVGQSFEGVISGLHHKGIFVMLSSTYCEGIIPIDSLPNSKQLQYDPKNYCFTNHYGKVLYKFGDSISVIVKQIDFNKNSMELALLS